MPPSGREDYLSEAEKLGLAGDWQAKNDSSFLEPSQHDALLEDRGSDVIRRGLNSRKSYAPHLSQAVKG